MTRKNEISVICELRMYLSKLGLFKNTITSFAARSNETLRLLSEDYLSSSIQACDIFADGLLLRTIPVQFTQNHEEYSDFVKSDPTDTSFDALGRLLSSAHENRDRLRRAESNQNHTLHIDRITSESSLVNMRRICGESHERLKNVAVESQLLNQARVGIDCIRQTLIEELARCNKIYEEKNSSSNISHSSHNDLRRRLEVLKELSHDAEQEIFRGTRRMEMVNGSHDHINMVLEKMKCHHVRSLHKLREVIINHTAAGNSTRELRKRAGSLHEEVVSREAGFRTFKDCHFAKLTDYRTSVEALSRQEKLIEDLTRTIVEISNRNDILIKSTADVKRKLDKFDRMNCDLPKRAQGFIGETANPTSMSSTNLHELMVAGVDELRKKQLDLQAKLARSQRLSKGKLVQISSQQSSTESSNFELHWKRRVIDSQSRDTPLPCIVEIIRELLIQFLSIRKGVECVTSTLAADRERNIQDSGTWANEVSYPDETLRLTKRGVIESQIRFALRVSEGRMTISLSELGLCGYDIPILIDSLQQVDGCIERISVLDLSRNSIVDSDLSYLRELIVILPHTAYLDISRNGLTEAGYLSAKRILG